MAIEKLYIDAISAYISTIGKSARVTISGVEKDYELQKTLIDGHTIKHFVYLTTETGVITDARLLDSQGRELQTKAFNVTKGVDGFVVAFVVALEIKEA